MDANTIYDRMLALFQEKSGVTVTNNTDLAVRLYAAAAELESLYGYCDWALNQSFPQTAVGNYLDLHANLRGLSRKAATRASGNLTFYLSEALNTAVTIPVDTVVTDGGGQRFVTTKPGTIAAGSVSCTVPAVAETAGENGNAAANTLCCMPVPPKYVTHCENTAAFTGGADGETDEALRKRVLNSYSRLPNGANIAFYEERALSHDGVKYVSVLPRNRGAGTVDVVIAGENGIPDSALVKEVRDDLAAVREISVDVAVSAPTAVSTDVSVTIWPSEEWTGEEAIAAVKKAVTQFFDGRLLAKPLYLSELGSIIFSTGAVRNYVITAPQTDVAITSSQIPVLHTLTVTEGA